MDRAACGGRDGGKAGDAFGDGVTPGNCEWGRQATCQGQAPFDGA